MELVDPIGLSLAPDLDGNVCAQAILLSVMRVLIKNDSSNLMDHLSLGI